MKNFICINSIVVLTLAGCTIENESEETEYSNWTRVPEAPSAPPQKIRPPNPLEGKTRLEVCSSKSLALIKWRFETLQHNFTGICCTMAESELDALHHGKGSPCGLDWPFNTTTECKAFQNQNENSEQSSAEELSSQGPPLPQHCATGHPTPAKGGEGGGFQIASRVILQRNPVRKSLMDTLEPRGPE